jgi:hypothetical protein
MPLLDHFNPPLSRTHPWRSFHGAWAAAMARLLNQGVLPQGFYAVPLVGRDGPIEIDAAAPQTWTPPAPAPRFRGFPGISGRCMIGATCCRTCHNQDPIPRRRYGF